jgi:thiosulfate/3-mercaptopyruvate sulfurtransferase
VTLSKPLVSGDWLAEHLTDADLAIADCRFVMATTEEGRSAYARAHLPGAVYFHLDEDLAAPVGPHGGRHPLPAPAVIARTLGAAGIGPGMKVVAYDWTGEHAARFWWLLRWLGHDEVAVLDGGYKAWEAAGRPLTSEPSKPQARTFTPNPRPEMIVPMEGVRTRPKELIVVDARSAERFAGQPSPLDPKPGHIPGAVSRAWQESLRPDGSWRSPAEQAARFAGLPEPTRLIHSCGSGVTACANLLAMEIAGLKGARLYPGSWGDWCSYDENPVEK